MLGGGGEEALLLWIGQGWGRPGLHPAMPAGGAEPSRGGAPYVIGETGNPALSSLSLLLSHLLG